MQLKNLLERMFCQIIKYQHFIYGCQTLRNTKFGKKKTQLLFLKTCLFTKRLNKRQNKMNNELLTCVYMSVRSDLGA